MVLRELFSNYATQSFLQVLGVHFNVGPQRQVDESLLIATTRGMNLGSKPFQNVVIDPNRDSGLARRGGQNCPSLRLSEIVLFLHRRSP